MANNKRTQYRTITHIPGKIEVNLPNGTKKTFKNSSEAQLFFDDNYGEGYAMEITSTTDGNGEVTINGGELPEVIVVGLAPKKKPESDTDRPAFSPHERRGVDKWIGANYSPRFNRASARLGMNSLNWPKHIDPSYWDSETHRNVVEGNNIAAGIVTAPFAAIAAAETAPTWAPWLSLKAMPFVAKHFIAPMAAGTAWDETQRAITGTTTTEQVSNYLQGKGWNPMAAEFVGGLTNPGYWINFGGTGRYTRPLFNKVGLGLSEPSAYSVLTPELNARLFPRKTLRERVTNAVNTTRSGVLTLNNSIQLGKNLVRNFKIHGYNLDIRYSLPTYYKSAGNVFNKDKYLLNGLWNIPIILLEMKSGLNKAQDYFSSQLRKDINTRNLTEAKLMGLLHFDINRNSANRVLQPLTSKAIADPNVSWYARINSPGANPLDDILEINLVSPDIENSVFHETLHRGSLGIAEPLRTGETFTAFRNRVKDTNKFYLKKVESFLKPRNEIPDELKNGYDYISESMETGANYFEAGLRLGIKAGSPYPGDDKVLEIIKNSETDPRMLGKEKLLSFARTDSEGLRNLWKALTGTLFIFPLIYGTFNSNSLNQ